LANEQVLAYSIEDIKAQYADKGDLVEVLTQVFIHLENLPWFTIMQGDVLWVDQTSRKQAWQEIEGTEFMTFKPNTLTYGVPGQSLDALLWTNKRVGVVFHTRYDGGVFINQMDTGFNVASQVYELQREAIGIHIQDALFEVDVRLMRGERQTIQALLKDSEARITPLLDTIASETHVTSPGYLWKLYVNSLIREDRLADYGHDVREFVWNRLSAHFNSLSSISARENWINRTATTMNWLRDNAQDWRKFVELYQNIMVMKDVLVGALNARGMDVRAFYTDADSGHLFETDHEGFVLIEKGVGAVKLVDRMNFSRRNMLSRKGWQG
jgi:hypothetical protein